MTATTTFLPTRAHPPARASTSSLTILLVDDSADMRLYLRGCLRPFSPVTIQEAANGREALDQIHERRPDLIISDVVMPEFDGLALCRALRDDVDLSDIPILLISGESESVDGLSDGWLEKPFNAGLLRTEVERLLGH